MSLTINYGRDCSVCKSEVINESGFNPSWIRCLGCLEEAFVCGGCLAAPCPKCDGELANKSETLPDSLYLAIASGDLDRVRSVVNKEGVDVNHIVNSTGEPPLIFAAIKGLYEICEYFIKSCGAHRYIENSNKRTALIEIVRNRSGSLSKPLLQLFSSTVNKQDDSGKTALMWAATGAGLTGSNRGSVSVIHQLLDMGADVLIKDKSGYTALGHAKRSNEKSPNATNEPVVEQLEAKTLACVAMAEFKKRYRYEISDNGVVMCTEHSHENSCDDRSDSGLEAEEDTPLALRYRAARSNAKLGSIKAAIEEVFGLPEGCVALKGPDGSALRSDARVATLRDRWE